MRTLNHILACLLFVFCGLIRADLPAQIIAGNVPGGANSFNPAVSLARSAVGVDSARIDLNADGIDDLEAVLSYGFPPIDWSHSAFFRILNPNLQFCVDSSLAAFQLEMAPLYNFGDTLNCTPPLAWSVQNEVGLGYIGCICPPAPFDEADRYVHYQLAGAEGWLHLSFDLSDLSGTIFFSISQVMYNGTANARSNLYEKPACYVYPNPASSGEVYLQSEEQVQSVTVWDASGRKLRVFDAVSSKIDLPEGSGTFFLQIETVDRMQIIPVLRR